MDEPKNVILIVLINDAFLRMSSLAFGKLIHHAVFYTDMFERNSRYSNRSTRDACYQVFTI